MEKKKITIAIATQSKDKIEGIESVFSKRYDVKTYAGKTESGVPDQPLGDETRQGAYNRIVNFIKRNQEKIKMLQQQGTTIDYYVSCEGGVVNLNGKYFNVHIICLYCPDKDTPVEKLLIPAEGKEGEFKLDDKFLFSGTSSGVEVPAEDIDEIRRIGVDRYWRNQGYTSLKEICGKTRAEVVAEGTQAALDSRNASLGKGDNQGRESQD